MSIDKEIIDKIMQERQRGQSRREIFVTNGRRYLNVYGEDCLKDNCESEIFGCPVCGYEWVHLEKPVVEGKIERGGADYYIKTKFHCEENHDGYIVFYHHEGLLKWWVEVI
jgi:hypothetical protein